MRKYEITFIVRPDLEEAEIKKTADSLVELLKKENSKIITEKNNGQKELAYEVKKFKTGYYFYLEVETTPEVVKEFDRIVKINENLLRHLIVKVED